jgi:regulatory protein
MPKERKPPALREQALACLARREHSRAELARKLENAGHLQEEISPLLDEFEARNWLSDRRYAESYVADHLTRSGAIKLAHELRQRGVDDNIIDAVLAETRDSELERAREVWRKKFGMPPANIQEKARQMRFMQSRGFDLETIRQLF